jgi:hypothetical protein
VELFTWGIFLSPERATMETQLSFYLKDKHGQFQHKIFEDLKQSEYTNEISEEDLNQLLVIFKRLFPEFNPLAHHFMLILEKDTTDDESYSATMIDHSYLSQN